jgi:hypothetical protein
LQRSPVSFGCMVFSSRRLAGECERGALCVWSERGPQRDCYGLLCCVDGLLAAVGLRFSRIEPIRRGSAILRLRTR